MYERFSNNAREAMKLAQQECRRLNYPDNPNCKVIAGTEYVLLGLNLLEHCTAASVLNLQGIDPQRLRFAAEAYIRQHQEPIDVDAWPPSPRIKTAVESAMVELRSMNHNYMGTEHLLLGVMHDTEGGGFHLLAQMGLTLANVREVVRLVRRGGATD